MGTDIPEIDESEGKVLPSEEVEVATADSLFGELDGLFTEDPTGRSSGLVTVQKPVPKKQLAKGRVMGAIPEPAVSSDSDEKRLASSEEDDDEDDDGEDDE